MASIWDGIDNAELDKRNTMRLPFLYPGKFLLRVKKVSHYPSQKNRKDHWFRADFDIVEGARDGVEEVSWVVNLSRGELAGRGDAARGRDHGGHHAQREQ
ncbi:hypothetical protein [Undibacterium luofuense]|uniref:hypothetical protein n=1 Tax=Undibacterium luofuense TaxID=2828733 RepID=UPI0030EB812D